MSKVKDIDCILAIDNSNLNIETNGGVEEKEFFGTKVKCLFFDENLNNKLNLPYYYENRVANSFSEVMWFHSDYRFYYVKHILPDYDYYWQFEYDIYCNGDSYSDFFKKYINLQGDLLICDLRQDTIKGDWYWSHGIEWAYDKIYGSFFPICRLSSQAIDFLYNKRFERFEQYLKLENNDNSRWLFGELFVPTELINNNYTASSINEKYVSSVNWNKEYDLNEDRFFEKPDNLLYHPVKGQLVNRIRKLTEENNELKKQISALQTQGKKFWNIF